MPYSESKISSRDQAIQLIEACEGDKMRGTAHHKAMVSATLPGNESGAFLSQTNCVWNGATAGGHWPEQPRRPRPGWATSNTAQEQQARHPPTRSEGKVHVGDVSHSVRGCAYQPIRHTRDSKLPAGKVSQCVRGQASPVPLLWLLLCWCPWYVRM